MNRILPGLIIAGIVVISGCVKVSNQVDETQNDTETQVLTPKEVLDNSESLSDKIISVKGVAKIDWKWIVCTEIACTPENLCCNTCSGPLVLHYNDNNISLSDVNNILNYYCSGNECTMNCDPLEEGKSYVVTGIWNGNFLELNSFEELITVTGRVYVAGNEPFTELVISTDDTGKAGYSLIGNLTNELWKLQNQNISVSGYLGKDSLIYHRSIEVTSYKINGPWQWGTERR